MQEIAGGVADPHRDPGVFVSDSWKFTLTKISCFVINTYVKKEYTGVK